MTELPDNLYRAEQVRELDRRAIEQHGIAGSELMERAGAAAFALLQERWPNARRIAVFCGAGNNGGDGYVLARLAHQAGLEVDISQLTATERLRGDALTACQAMCETGLQPTAGLLKRPYDYDVIVDAILGTGLSGEVSGTWRMAIDTINQYGVPVLALDIPSGLHADSGAVLGTAIRAEHTLTFIGLKQGMFTGDAPDYCGRIHFNNLGVPAEVYAKMTPAARCIRAADQIKLLQTRPHNAHKGMYGHVLVIGGNHGMAGAARMAGEAAARMGAGLVSIATRAAHASQIAGQRPELMCAGVESPGELDHLLQRATVVAIGPGLGQDVWARTLLRHILKQRLPMVVDADALNLLAEEPVKRRHWVLTPHPGEAARLLECTTTTITRDRFAAVEQLRQRYGGVAVLKGAGSLISCTEGPILLAKEGNPGMASGGMGDVLTGIIAGLLAQGLSPDQAAGLGVCLHGAAGDLAAQGGERGLLAMDLMPHLRRLVNLHG